MTRRELRRTLATVGVTLPLDRRERLLMRWSKLRTRCKWFTMTLAPMRSGDTIASLRYVIHVRRWHPGWWLFLARAYWHALRGTRLSLAINWPHRKAHPHG